MYTLYKTIKDEARQIVGYYEDIMEGAAAIEEDKNKFDEEAKYELEQEDDAN